MRSFDKPALISLLIIASSSCFLFESAKDASGSKVAPRGREAMFVGVDISGSFKRGGHFNDALRFLSHYIYVHLKGLGGAEIPHSLFVGSIGGAKPDEPKTFYPIQTFQYRSIKEIEAKLREIFPKRVENPNTDYNAFFRQIAVFVRNKKLAMRRTSIIMLSDGIPDVPKKDGKHNYNSIILKPLENLSRNITIRLLYTSAEVGINWQTKVKRTRVKIWTQDANVMKDWKDPHIFDGRKPLDTQARFLSWIKDNVDFAVRRPLPY